jgi:ribose transport system permease protein
MSTTTQDTPPAPAEPSARRGFDFGTAAQRYALVVAWIALIVGFGIAKSDTFLATANWTSILSTQAVVVILTLGLIIPLTTGDFDLSVAYNLSFCSVLVAVLNVNHGWPIGAAIIVTILCGAFIGFLNGAISMVARIDPIIVTLGMGTFVYGMALMISNQTTISGVSDKLSEWVVLKAPLGIPIQFYYALAVMLIVWWVFELTSVGRRMLIVGRGRSVAKLSGLNVNRIRLGALVAAGTLAGVAGVLYTGTSGSADPTSGASFLLPSFAAAFLGATAIMPGRFNPIGAVIATYFLATGINGLQLLGAQGYVQQLFYGGALIIAVTLSQLSRRGKGGDAVAGPSA